MPASLCDCCGETVAEVSERRNVKRNGRSHVAEGQRRAAKDGAILPGCMSWVRINGRKSFSNKSLHGRSDRRLLAQAPLGHSQVTSKLEAFSRASGSAQRRAVHRLEYSSFPNVPKVSEAGRRPNQRAIENADRGMVDVTGIEPATPCLQSRCSPS